MNPNTNKNMPQSLINAAKLRTQEGVEFIAFFDLKRTIESDQDAENFLKSMLLISPCPMALVYWLKGEKDSCVLADPPTLEWDICQCRPNDFFLRFPSLDVPDVPQN